MKYTLNEEEYEYYKELDYKFEETVEEEFGKRSSMRDALFLFLGVLIASAIWWIVSIGGSL